MLQRTEFPLIQRRPAPCGRRKREQPVVPVNQPGVKAIALQ